MVKVLFVCMHNSARSQMAEGFTRHFGKGLVEVFSAGTEATTVNPYAIEVMAEIGIDISQQYSKAVFDLPTRDFDYVITLCEESEGYCPFVYAKAHLSWALPDPAKSKDDVMQIFRDSRDVIKLCVLGFIKSLSEQ